MGIIPKDEFKKLQIDELDLYVTGFSRSVLAHTEYQVQISIQDKYFYLKNTRFRHLEAFDQVIQKKFANLEFPKLPDKAKLINFNKEKDR